MDKYLTVDFFKKQQFPSKTDGMDFIKSHKALSKLMVEKSDEIDEFKYNKINEFSSYFEEYNSDKKNYLIRVKDKQKERIQNKKDMIKNSMKDDMRNEIMKEIAMENNITMYPKYEKSVDYNNIDVLFSSAIDNKNALSKQKILEIEKMKIETELALHTLANIISKMSLYTSL